MTSSAGALAATAATSAIRTSETASIALPTKLSTLCGEWLFHTDSTDSGMRQQWYGASASTYDWRKVSVPHTWQVEPELAEYFGVSWYRRKFDVPTNWQKQTVRVEFEAIFHTATVWVNGLIAGEHRGKGYTAFTLEISQFLHWGGTNVIAVRVDNSFNEHMLPRGRSSDWTHDGGIYRPAQLLISPKVFVERVDVEAAPNLAEGSANLDITAYIRNTSEKDWIGGLSYNIIDDTSGLAVLSGSGERSFSIKAGTLQAQRISVLLTKATLWHFDHPNLYRLEFSVAGTGESHCFITDFGVRKFEIKEGAFFLNGERVRLMGVERMAGSNPEFGMAEPTDWLRHDLADLKNLNCIFTRVHWPQDKRVLDYCDRHGILMQTEVPTWGEETFARMGPQPDEDILENGLEQLREMIARDRNHPSIVVWGLCNEIGGQNPPAYQFAKRLLQEAKSLDSSRLCSYASNSMESTPERDVAGLMDFIEVNEYFGTWAQGSPADAGRLFDAIHATYHGKPIVVSEYGYCSCTPDRPEGDGHRQETLREHDRVIRSKEFIEGAIFFCYNDYRTHIGDRGEGVLKQRVHGVVDVYGEKKPSYQLLRNESSPIESLSLENNVNAFQVVLKTRGDVPMYTLRGYILRGTFYGQGDIPVEQQEVAIPEMAPASSASVELKFTQSATPVVIRFEVLRPTKFSAYSLDWKP